MARSAKRKKPASDGQRSIRRKRDSERTAAELSHRHDRGGMYIEGNRCCRGRDEVLVVLERREDGVDDSTEGNGGFDNGEEETVGSGEGVERVWHLGVRAS